MVKNKEILIGKYLSGNASPDETAALNSWLKQHPDHEREFEKVKQLWNTSLALKSDKDADVDAAWEEFKTLTAKTTKTITKTKAPRYVTLKIAAAISFFVVMGLVVKFSFSESEPASPKVLSEVNTQFYVPEVFTAATPDLSPVYSDSIALEEEETTPHPTKKPKRKFSFNVKPAIAMITVTSGDSAEIFMLPDNSIVYLNENSKLEYPQDFGKGNRRVSLVGEAYFEIKKESDQFIVDCQNTVVRGNATTFNVKSYTYDKSVEVIVATGNVEFSGVGYKDFKKLTINTNEGGYYDKAKSTLTKTKNIRKNYRWWQKKSLRNRIKGFFNRLTGGNG